MTPSKSSKELGHPSSTRWYVCLAKKERAPFRLQTKARGRRDQTKSTCLSVRVDVYLARMSTKWVHSREQRR